MLICAHLSLTTMCSWTTNTCHNVFIYNCHSPENVTMIIKILFVSHQVCSCTSVAHHIVLMYKFQSVWFVHVHLSYTTTCLCTFVLHLDVFMYICYSPNMLIYICHLALCVHVQVSLAMCSCTSVFICICYFLWYVHIQLPRLLLVMVSCL